MESFFSKVFRHETVLSSDNESPFRKSEFLTRSYTKSRPEKTKTPARMSVYVVSNSSEQRSKVTLESFQPVTALHDDSKGVAAWKNSDSDSSFEMPPTKSSVDSTEMIEDSSCSSSDRSGATRHHRLGRSLSVMQRREDVPKRRVKIRDEDGELTLEFKKLLVDLAKRRLKEEVESYGNSKLSTEDTSFILMKGGLACLRKIKDADLKVDGATSMIPEEYRLDASKADQGHTETDILQYDIERMRGSSMQLGTGQTTRQVPKGTTVTSNQENLVRKLVEIGFLLNDRSVTLTIARFIETKNSVDFFRLLGLRQRSNETARVLLNSLFSQEYKAKELSVRRSSQRNKFEKISEQDNPETFDSASWTS